jgi:hypothetical protein
MVKTITMVFLGMGLFVQLKAQDSTKTVAKAADTTKPAPTPPPVTITGSVDAYYRYNFNAPKGFTNNYTSFTNSQNSFELGMASIRADHSFGKVGATVDLGFGRRAQEFSYNDNGTLVAVKQAYVTFQASSKLKFTMGKWGTHIGYEVLDAYANRNYSMDYMFSLGPFFHTGLKMDVTLSPTTAFMVGIANPTDFSTTSSGTKVALAQFSTGTKDGKWKFFLNYQGYGGGTTDDSTLAPGYVLYKSLNQFDLVINGTLSSKFGVGFNGTVQSVKSSTLGSASWWGAAAYLNFDPSAMFGLTLRGEYFSDKDGLKIKPNDQPFFPITGLDVFDLTLTGLIHAGTNLTIMPEIRLDQGSKNFFYKSSSITPTESTVSALLAVVYHF